MVREVAARLEISVLAAAGVKSCIGSSRVDPGRARGQGPGLLGESGIAGEKSRHQIAKALYILDRRVTFLRFKELRSKMSVTCIKADHEPPPTCTYLTNK